MAKAITLMKLALLHDKYEDEFSPAEWIQINRLAEFVALVYGRYFLQSALAVAAPRLDLCFIENVQMYQVSS